MPQGSKLGYLQYIGANTTTHMVRSATTDAYGYATLSHDLKDVTVMIQSVNSMRSITMPIPEGEQLTIDRIVKVDYQRLIKFIESVRFAVKQPTAEAQATGCKNAIAELDRGGPLLASEE